MTRQIVMSEEEYEKLNENSVNIFLESRVIELETELEKYKIYKSQLEQESDRLASAATTEPSLDIDYPFEIEDGILTITNPAYFVSFFNWVDQSSIKSADTEVFNYLTNLATSLRLNLCWTSVQELKRYRVDLQKQGLYKIVKIQGAVQLLKL